MIRTVFPALVICLSMAHLIQANFNRVGLSTEDHSKKVVCYWGTWSNYRKDLGKFTLDNLDPNLCTHIIYSFAALDKNTWKIKSLDPWLDLGTGGHTGKRGFLNATDMKRRNPNLKVTLAIGGWNEGSEKYSLMAKDADRRRAFVKSVVTMLREYNFDGLDLDWEYPGKRGGDAEDKANFVKLIKELRRAFQSDGFSLTAAIGAAPGTIDVAYDIPALYEYLDLVHVMSYDYHGSWDQKTGHNAPMYSKPFATGKDLEFTIDYTWKHLKSLGAIAHKTVMGVPFYGRSFNLLNPHDSRMGARASKTGFSGPYTKENGFLGYNEICEMLTQDKTWTREWDENCQAPYVYNGIKWIGYDDPDSITKKVEYAMGEGMAGIMVWSVDTDDFLGKCGQNRYPLLRSINEALVEVESREGSGAAPSPAIQSFIVATLALINAIYGFLRL